MTTVTAKPHRFDLHSSSVSSRQFAAGYRGFLHVAGGHICLPHARHAAPANYSIVAPRMSDHRDCDPATGVPMPVNAGHSSCALSAAAFPPRFVLVSGSDRGPPPRRD